MTGITHLSLTVVHKKKNESQVHTPTLFRGVDPDLRYLDVDTTSEVDPPKFTRVRRFQNKIFLLYERFIMIRENES